MDFAAQRLRENLEHRLDRPARAIQLSNAHCVGVFRRQGFQDNEFCIAIARLLRQFHNDAARKNTGAVLCIDTNGLFPEGAIFIRSAWNWRSQCRPGELFMLANKKSGASLMDTT